MAKFNFQENAEAIFDKSVAATPLPFRGIMKSGLIKLLMENYGEDKEITEAGLIEIIKKNTPRPFLGKGMKAIAPLVSDPSLVEL